MDGWAIAYCALHAVAFKCRIFADYGNFALNTDTVAAKFLDNSRKLYSVKAVCKHVDEPVSSDTPKQSDLSARGRC